MRTKIKICGIKDRGIAQEIIKLKPDYLGVIIDYPKSPRSVSLKDLPDVIVPEFEGWVYLFVNQPIDIIDNAYKTYRPAVFQFHGNESPEFIKKIKEKYKVEIWKAINADADHFEATLEAINEYIKVGVDKVLFDAVDKNSFGGTGKKADWELIKKLQDKIETPIILAGGLNPENVDQCIKQLNPAIVDVSSGVEKEKGTKDLSLVSSFITTAHSIIVND